MHQKTQAIIWQVSIFMIPGINILESLEFNPPKGPTWRGQIMPNLNPSTLHREYL